MPCHTADTHTRAHAVRMCNLLSTKGGGQWLLRPNCLPRHRNSARAQSCMCTANTMAAAHPCPPVLAKKFKQGGSHSMSPVHKLVQVRERVRTTTPSL
mmetsp:Transcript_35195/g.88547  ORF Transcript_35195/g.88547 Transcript_35195/m.88547 type:complete len:98 (+) Transcript_35195:51-344(+)